MSKQNRQIGVVETKKRRSGVKMFADLVMVKVGKKSEERAVFI